MYRKTSIAALSAAERIALRNARLRSGQCVRCFHATQQRAAGEQDDNKGDVGNDRGTPINTPNRGSTRQQRSARISDEVNMLARGDPKGRTSGQEPSHEPSIRGRTIDPEAVGEGVGSGAMGENYSYEQEGPGAQSNASAARNVKNDADDMDRRYSSTVRGTSDAGSVFPTEVEVDTDRRAARPSKGFRSASKQEDLIEDKDDEDADDEGSGPYSRQYELNLLEQFDRQEVGSVPARADPTTREGFLQLGQNGSIIVANNFEGVVEDRIRIIAEPTQDGFRHPPYLAQKLLNGGLIRFESHEEKDAVIAAAREIAERRGRIIAKRKGEDEPLEPINFDFAPLPEAVREATVDKMVKGKYDEEGLLSGKSKYPKQPVLDGIARMTLKNGTYLSDDGERFLKKVQSLLPSQAAQQAQQKRAGK
ncbi:hypothetical protein MBLNU230_g3810t1 [Neophaeotheca triangularis]